MNNFKTILLALAMLLPFASMRADDDEDYRKYAEEVRQEIWQKQMPEFQQTKCPDKYKGHSAVILAAYSEVITDQHRKAKLYDILVNKRLTREVSCESYYRQLLAINDVNALKKYSEFDFQTSSKSYFYQWKSENTLVLGIRIIKPDGKVVEVGTDDYVQANQGKKGEEKRQKLAVPGLQVGDLLDIFVFESQDLEESNVDPFTFYFVQPYPLLSYKVHCVIDPDLTTQYRTLNGAPDFVQSTDEDKNIVLDASVSNVEITEPSLWYIEKCQTPQTLVYITGKKLMGTSNVKSIKKKGLQANPDAKVILADDIHIYDYSAFIDYQDKPLLAVLKGHKDLMKLDLPEVEKANRMYDMLTYGLFASKFRHSDAQFTAMLGWMLRKMDIENELCITTTEDNEPIDHLISYQNTQWGIKLKNSDTYYFPSSRPKVPSEPDIEIAGRKAVMKSGQEVVLPQGSADDNTDKAVLRVSIDQLSLHIDRTHTLTGLLKESPSRRLTTLEDYVNKLRQLAGVEKDAVEARGKKYVEDMKETFRKGREQEREDYESDIELYHGTKCKSLDAYKTLCLGCSSDSAAFIYNVQYTMDGYVKKAGTNLILSIGQLIGEQLKVEGDERSRTADVMRRYPCTLEWDIRVALPAGYSVSAESLSKLNARLTNSFGTFEATASQSQGELVLHVQKRYHKAEAPNTEWPDILRFVDAASNYNALQVVLKK